MPKHITVAMELHRTMLDAVARLPADIVIDDFTEVGSALERLLEKYNIHPEADDKAHGWIFRDGAAEKNLTDILRDANSALGDIAVLFSGIERAGVQVVDKIGTGDADQSDEWLGTAIKSMADQGVRIADECMEKCRPIFRRAANAPERKGEQRST
jgi:hypothetical protein